MEKLKKQKVAVAMSGGVDSGVAAALLVKAGFKCTGFHLHLWSESFKDKQFENKCCSTESLRTARKTAHQLGILFYPLDFSKLFKRKVVDYFLKAYKDGLTPNPCIVCNQTIKFGELFNYVRKLGFDYLATGHYAQIKKGQKGFHLLAGKDKTKDQSYFLYRLKQSQLPDVLFPVGGYLKNDVRQLAKKWDLPVAHRPESQEICFLPENDYRPFLKRNLKSAIKPGQVVDLKGRVIGQHQGLPLYTLGQRHGFILSSKLQTPLLPPYYVMGKEVKKNLLVIGFGQETERKEFGIKDLNWLVPDYQKELSKPGLKVRIRHQGAFLACRLKGDRVILKEKERGVAPGQSAVFYLKDEVLGGGFISN
ncbi:tRNA 2-thiouridine(34) synthase MnmA [Candidatus Shapirobacteria bacterium]|nr:tRNA 2-thiouridine(34) synthase MnmA [Candidatus Shapirobacteria bacterium]